MRRPRLARAPALIAVLELLHELDLLGDALARRRRVLLGVEAEQVPGLAAVPVLAHVPAAVLLLAERERDAVPRLEPPLVAELRAELVQHAAVVVEHAPAVDDGERAQALLPAPRQPS